MQVIFYFEFALLILIKIIIWIFILLFFYSITLSFDCYSWLWLINENHFQYFQIMYILKSNPCGSIPIFQLVHFLSVTLMAPKSKAKAVAIPECVLYVTHYYFFIMFYIFILIFFYKNLLRQSIRRCCKEIQEFAQQAFLQYETCLWKRWFPRRWRFWKGSSKVEDRQRRNACSVGQWWEFDFCSNCRSIIIYYHFFRSFQDDPGDEQISTTQAPWNGCPSFWEWIVEVGNGQASSKTTSQSWLGCKGRKDLHG